MADNKADTCYIQPIHPNLHLTVTSAKMLPLLSWHVPSHPHKMTWLLPHFAVSPMTRHVPIFFMSCERKKNDKKNLCSGFSPPKKCFIKRLMFIDFSFMSVLLFCLRSGKRSLCIIICERSKMSEVSFWCWVQTSYKAPPVQLCLCVCVCVTVHSLAHVLIVARIFRGVVPVRCLCAYATMSVRHQPPPVPFPEGAEWALKQQRSSPLT